MRDDDGQLLARGHHEALEKALTTEPDPGLRRRCARRRFERAMTGPGPPDAAWVKRLTRLGLQRALSAANREELVKCAYQRVASALEANIAAYVVKQLKS